MGRSRQKEKGQNSPAKKAATMSHGGDVTLPPDLDKLRAVLLSDLTTTLTTTMKMVVDEALRPISAALDAVKSTTDSLNLKITTMETALSDHSDRLTALEETCTRLQSENTQLMAKTEDLELQSRCNNLRMIGIPEKTEGADPVKFMATFLTEVLGASFFSSPPILDRAHRIGPAHSAEEGKGARPRVFIVRFHYLSDKERVLRGERDAQQLKYHGQNVYFFPDMTTNIAKKRASFAGVKRCLYEKQVRFSLLFPARLRVEHRGEKRFFECPKEAQTFYDSQFSARWWFTDYWTLSSCKVKKDFSLDIGHLKNNFPWHTGWCCFLKFVPTPSPQDGYCYKPHCFSVER